MVVAAPVRQAAGGDPLDERGTGRVPFPRVALGVGPGGAGLLARLVEGGRGGRRVCLGAAPQFLRLGELRAKFGDVGAR